MHSPRPTPPWASAVSAWWQRRPEGFGAFVAVAVLAQVSLGWPSAAQRPSWAVASTCALAVTLVLAAGLVRAGERSWLRAAPAFAFLGVVALWREAAGGATSGFAPMLGLAVLWLALHGTLRQVWVAVAGVALVMVVPMIAVGGPDYPSSDWRRTLLWVALASLMGPLTHRVVREREESVRRAAEFEPAHLQLQGVLDAAEGHAIIATDLDGTVTLFNTGAEQMLGVTAASVVGRRALADFHSANQFGTNRLEASFETLIVEAPAGSRTYDDTYRRADGTSVPVRVTTSAITNNEGLVVGVVSVASDQSAVHEALRSARESAEQWRLLVDNLPATTVGLLDADLTWLAVSGHYLERAGLSSDQLVGRPIGTTVQRSVTDAIRHLASRGRSEQSSLLVEVRPGQWLEIDVVPIASGAVGRVLVVARDVTERREAELERERLHRVVEGEERRFRALFEQAPTGVTLTSAPTSGLGTFLAVNRAFALMLGYDSSELVGRPVLDFVHSDDRVAATQWVAERPDATHQYRCTHRSGRPIWIEAHHTILIDPEGGHINRLSQLVDVTSRRSAERALLDALDQQRAAARALREADAVRTDVMATVSHELRTPLTSIRGYLELLLDDHTELSWDQRNMLEVVQRNAQALLTMVEDLSVLTRLEEPELPHSERRPVVVADAVSAAVDTVMPLARDKAQELVVLVEPGCPAILADLEHVDRALINLLSNAIKYTRPHGHITVSISASSDGVNIAVSDDGDGIAAHDISRLFTRFFRTSGARDSGEAGTGLGLAIVKTLAELNGGRVSVSSEPGSGSTFTLTFPRVHLESCRETGTR